MAEWLMRADRATREILDQAALEQLLSSVHGNRHRSYSRSLLLAVLMLEVWLADTLPRALSLASSD